MAAIIDAEREHAHKILLDRRIELKTVAERLLVKETLERSELEAFVSPRRALA